MKHRKTYSDSKQKLDNYSKNLLIIFFITLFALSGVIIYNINDSHNNNNNNTQKSVIEKPYFTKGKQSSIVKGLDKDKNIVQSGSHIRLISNNGSSQITVSCTLGFVTENFAYTAKHCGETGQKVLIDNKQIGFVAGESTRDDLLQIKLFSKIDKKISKITYDNVTIGEHVSKYGIATGHTEGEVTGLPTKTNFNVNDEKRNTIAFSTNMCVEKGDSGAGVLNDKGEIIGIVSLTNNTECLTNNKPTESSIVPISDYEKL